MSSNSDSLIKLQAIFDTAIDGIIVINDRGIIEELNSATCHLFGYERSEMEGKNVSMLMPAEHSRHHDDYLERYKHTRMARIIGIGREVMGLRNGGMVFPFWLSVVEIPLDERTLYAGFIHDLSKLKEAERKLKVMNEILERKVMERTYELENAVNQLLALNRKLEVEIAQKITAQNELHEREIELEKSLAKERELGELKSRFVSMASHEFRTPLSTIQSSVSLIGRYQKSEEQPNREKHINKVRSSVTHLTGILNDFLSLNKLEEGKVVTNLEHIDILELANEITEEMKALLKTGQVLRTQFDIEAHQVYSDRKILKNILLNLISNAIKYSDENASIDFNLKTNSDLLEFSIRDYGIGIPEEEQKHLFDRFFRASNVINIEGTGLGLNIVKKYVEMLGGEIDFNSVLNEGTTFKVVLPEDPRRFEGDF